MPHHWLAFLRSLWPAPQGVSADERLRAVVGAGLGIGLAAWLSHLLAPWPELPWLVAPLGASAVLVFAVPASPLAQPWSVLSGNTLSAAVGLLAAHWIAPTELAAGVAVAGAMTLMLLTRCLHPPGGAAALLMVITGAHDWHVALAPVALNSALLVLAGMLYNPLTGRRYPHRPERKPADATTLQDGNRGFSEADLDAVLARYNQVLDLPRDDLRELIEGAQAQASRRQLVTVRCRDLMVPDPATVEFGTSLEDAWALLRRAPVRALPVVDRYGHLVGIVTQTDFLRCAGLEPLGRLNGLSQRLQKLLRPTPGLQADKPEVVGQIMTRSVRVVSADRSLSELLPLFSSSGHRHIPVIGERNRVVGLLSQTDLIAALARAGATPDEPPLRVPGLSDVLPSSS